MKSEYAGADAQLHVDFLNDNQFVIPDAGSVYLTIRGTNGAPLAGFNKVQQATPTLNSANYLLPASINFLEVGSQFEVRYCRVDYKAGNVPLVYETSYRVIPFLPIQARPQDVRDQIGCQYTELPDEAVDIYASFLVLNGRSNFLAALNSPTMASVHANRALVYQEALRVSPSLINRLFKTEQKDNAVTTRNNLDLASLMAGLSAGLGQSLADMDTALGTSTTFIPPPLMVVSLPTDPVTGA